MRRPTEDQCEDAIVAAAILAGWRVHVERRSQTKDGYRTAIKGHVGWPDIFMVRNGVAMAIELKRKPRKIDPDQDLWLERLKRAGVDARLVWVPEGMQEFIDEITRR